jgi:hypothetical protein
VRGGEMGGYYAFFFFACCFLRPWMSMVWHGVWSNLSLGGVRVRSQRLPSTGRTDEEDNEMMFWDDSMSDDS